MTETISLTTGTRRQGLRVALAALFAGGVAIAAAPAAHARGFWGGDSLDPVELNRRIEYGVGRALTKIEATDEQKKKVTAIVQSASADLKGLREKHMEGRKAMREAMEGATIDKARLEKVRGEQVQLADAASKRFVQAMTDAGEVLSADQRQKFFKQMEERRGMRR